MGGACGSSIPSTARGDSRQKNGEFSVTIALLEEGSVVVGVVLEPAARRLTYAVRGGGCWRQDGDAAPTACRVTAVRDLAAATLTQSRSKKGAGPSPLVSVLAPARVRETYSAGIKLALVARGDADYYVNSYEAFHDWDAAGHILVGRSRRRRHRAERRAARLRHAGRLAAPRPVRVQRPSPRRRPGAPQGGALELSLILSASRCSRPRYVVCWNGGGGFTKSWGPIQPHGPNTTRTKKGDGGPMKIQSLEDLLADQLKDLYSAENQLVRLPKMAKGASAPDLRRGFEEHLEQTRGHVQRLEQVCQELGVTPKGKKCAAMEGWIEEGKELLEEDVGIWPSWMRG